MNGFSRRSIALACMVWPTLTASAAGASTSCIPNPLPCPTFPQGNSQIIIPFGTGQKTIASPVTGPGTVTTSEFGVSWTASSTVQSSLAAFPWINVTAYASATDGGFASADSVLQISYEIEITGTSGIVPLTVEANERITSSTAISSSSSVELDLHLFSSAAYVETFEAGSDNGKPVDLPYNPFPVAQTYNTLANTPIEVEMLASAAADVINSNGVEVSASAYLDPFFSVPSGYSILTSPGVGNSPIPAIPEAGTWVMVILGFGALGLVARGSVLRAA